jgi:hypothetical protein
MYFEGGKTLFGWTVGIWLLFVGAKNFIGFCLFSWQGDEKVFLTPTVYPIFQRPIDGFVKGRESNHCEERGGRRNLRKLTAQGLFAFHILAISLWFDRAIQEIFLKGRSGSGILYSFDSAKDF